MPEQREALVGIRRNAEAIQVRHSELTTALLIAELATALNRRRATFGVDRHSVPRTKQDPEP